MTHEYQLLTDGTPKMANFQNQTLYFVTHSRARSGMSRRVSIHVMENKNLINVTQDIADILGRVRYSVAGVFTLKLNGYGTDVAHDLARDLEQSEKIKANSIKTKWIS